ncbi:HIT family protein [Citricoccus muralis]|uniref:HIT family protein n=1 Tax=Citricoccus muralis TaxID=169134 RepID=A0ABY8HAM0_9MICC|nr:HIT family protein [Citricoccus muralis]WFP17667.1 HIT family protein [Citricoccus muralis]
MPTVFTRIIDGDLPGRFVWKDETCVAFLSIGPLAAGHTLVVPREEIDLWTDASPELVQHLMTVAHTIGAAQRTAFGAARAGLMLAGYEVPHLHVHVWPSNSLSDFDLDTVDNHPDPADLDAAAEKLRAQLRAEGHEATVPQA